MFPIEQIEYDILARRSKKDILDLRDRNDPYFSIMYEDDRFWNLVCEYHISPNLDFNPGFHSYENLVEFIWEYRIDALKISAKENNRSVLDFLLEGCEKFDLDQALIKAISGNHVELIKYLVNKGADNLGDAFHKAVAHNYIEIVKYLLGKITKDIGSLNLALSLAAYMGYIELVEYLILQGANDIDNALFNAINGNRLNICQFLIKFNVNLDQALLYATKRNRKEIISLLKLN